MAKAKSITGLDAQAPTSQNARTIARMRLDEVYSWSTFVDSPYSVQELHNLRIAAKRLRYTLEIFEEVLPEECKAVVKELEQIQEELGQLHDSDVMIAMLRLCLGSQESPLDDQAIATAQQDYQGNKKSFLRPELMTELLDPAHSFSAAERYGLEQLVLKQQQQREEQYATFRRHWYALQEQDFRRHLLHLLDTVPVAS